MSRREGAKRVMMTVFKKNLTSLHYHKLKGYRVSAHSKKISTIVIMEKQLWSGRAQGTNGGDEVDGGADGAGGDVGNDLSRKAYQGSDVRKARTNSVSLDKNPVNNFIYNWAIYFAPHSQKDWACGHRYICIRPPLTRPTLAALQPAPVSFTLCFIVSRNIASRTDLAAATAIAAIAIAAATITTTTLAAVTTTGSSNGLSHTTNWNHTRSGSYKG